MIRYASFIQCCIVFCCAPVVVIMRLLAWSKINATTLYVQYKQFQPPSFEEEIIKLPFSGKVSFFTVESVAILFILGALWNFWKMLDLYKQKIYFSMDVLRRLKKISVLLLVWSVYQLLFATVTSLIVSFFKMPGERCVMIAVSAEDLLRFFVVMILFMILHILHEAYKIKMEQDLVV